jgi:uncharacterized membrane protein YoaK (UPF0700 family)
MHDLLAACTPQERSLMTERPRHVHLLVSLLTFTSGCVDVVTLTVIGGAFTSVITGNLIFIGRAIGTSSPTPALHAVMGVVGYVLGVAAGSRLAHMVGRFASAAAWPRKATIVLSVECVVLLAANVAWIGDRANLPGAATDMLLVALALALGMQGAAARTIAGNPSTTYMTGALTALVEALATGRARGVDASAAVGLVSLVVGAASGALLVEHASRLALLPPLAALLLVVAIKTRHHDTERRTQEELDHAAR